MGALSAIWIDEIRRSADGAGEEATLRLARPPLAAAARNLRGLATAHCRAMVAYRDRPPYRNRKLRFTF